MPIETTPVFVTRGTGPAPDAELVAVPFGPGPALAPDAAPWLELPVPVDALLAHYEAKGEPGEVVEAPTARDGGVRRVLLYGIGDGSAAASRKAGAAVARRAKGRASLSVVVPSEGRAAALAEGALLAAYTFTIGDGRAKPVKEIVFIGGDERDLREGETAARATALARDLVNTPSSVKTPAWLAEQAKAVAAGAGLGVRVWEGPELGEFGGIRAVGQGSISPPCLIQLSYTPDNPRAHVVLAGKGITFDTGGLSLKPTEGMKAMKTDMAGGAAVIAVMSALAAVEAPVRVTGLVACAENSISGSAQRPGDVITQYGGRTVEVLNTDAEGRLVLADALAYAHAELDPDVVIDIATLTGAAKVALGPSIGAVYATDESLAAALLEAGEAAGDRLWRMPLVEDYRTMLESDVADLANVDREKSGAAGSIAAALFLREFTGGRPWAHLDIAGPARAGSDEGEITKGGTGFGVRLLLRYLAA
ncbi:leucyl aminopeptidase [Microbispora rosea subsp. aerata]|nr:M17 family metallopeptidase [Microbispora rosea]GGO27885.1 leucyl aminopeptidase [Microbispora rosea subsp. aerata]GIH56972.1 leucyl aminopeptidase [Microbispora rosea subsp. aerata]GLJ82899.1 leucyl aminopeptidase [Microbispora rosea subsp. aerata]